MQKQQKESSSRRVAIILLVSVLAIVLVGMIVRANRNKTIDVQTDANRNSSEAEAQTLASFPEFDPRWQADETDLALPAVTDGTAGTTQAQVRQTETAGDTTATTTGTTIGAADTTASTAASSTTAASSSASSTAAGSTLHNYQTGEAYAYAYAGYTPQTANLDIADWRLLLVNRNYMLPQDYAPELAEAVKGSGVRMDARVAPYYQQMYDAALKDGMTLTPLSGHRRISTQKTNFENKIQYYMNQGYDKVKATQKAAEIILPPGTSEHNAGLCMDIISLDVSFENTKAFAWLQANAQDYGFILRYPKGKESVTQITYEPWHWRYVGVENAKKINQSGKCLEEYLGMQ